MMLWWQDELKPYLLDNIVVEDGPLEEPCWIWTGNAHPNGYGAASHRGVQDLAHRMAYRVLVEEIPKGLQINHHCDIKLCINPAHLYCGTQQDNIDDMWRRGRGLSGENNPTVILSDEQVAEALQMLHEGKSQGAVARHFGVGDNVIHSIARGHTRRSVPGPRPEKVTYSRQFRGVTRDYSRRSRPWAVSLKAKGRTLHLGAFGFKSDAAICWNYHVAYLGLDRPLNQVAGYHHN
jgi:HNH endonuclease